MSIEVTVEYAHREWNSYDHVVHIRNYQQLQAKVAELEEENARLSEVVESNIDDGINKIMAMSDEQVSALAGFEGSNPEDKATIARQCVDIAMLRVDLAAEQLNNKLLRDALEHCMTDGDFDTDDARTSFKEGMKALAIPHDTSVLDAYMAEKVKEEMK